MSQLKISASNEYLIQKWIGGNPHRIECLGETQTSYRIRFEHSDPFYITKKDFEADWKVIEHLGAKSQSHIQNL